MLLKTKKRAVNCPSTALDKLAEEMAKRNTALDKLREKLPELMFQYDYQPNTSDYRCAFCGKRANTNLGEITHTEDCLGNLLLSVLAEE